MRRAKEWRPETNGGLIGTAARDGAGGLAGDNGPTDFPYLEAGCYGERECIFQWSLAGTKITQPVSALLSGTPSQTIAGLSKVVRPPPKVRAAAPPIPMPEVQRHVAEDQPWDPLMMEGVPESGSPVAQAILQQSKALAALVAHMSASGTDPVSDLCSSTPTAGFKGTMV